MEPDVFQHEFLTIVEGSAWIKKLYRPDDVLLRLSEEQFFNLWNVLGEELGIDLSLLTTAQRALLLNYCKKNSFFSAKEFTALLWLIYYSDLRH